jgi:hypothetical protein
MQLILMIKGYLEYRKEKLKALEKAKLEERTKNFNSLIDSLCKLDKAEKELIFTKGVVFGMIGLLVFLKLRE